MSIDADSRVISIDDHLHLCAQGYLSAVNPHTYPILIGSQGSDRLIQIGTGIAICTGNRYFLVTAGHVINQILNPQIQDIFVGTGTIANPGNTHVLPASSAEAWRLHKNSDFDIAAACLTHPIPALSFFDISQFTHRHLEAMRGHYFLAGYPNSRNKSQDVNPVSGEKRSAIASIIVKVDHALDYQRDSKNSDDYLGFEYKRVFEEGHLKTTGTHLRGLSGAGLWYFPQHGN